MPDLTVSVQQDGSLRVAVAGTTSSSPGPQSPVRGVGVVFSEAGRSADGASQTIQLPDKEYQSLNFYMYYDYPHNTAGIPGGDIEGHWVRGADNENNAGWSFLLDATGRWRSYHDTGDDEKQIVGILLFDSRSDIDRGFDLVYDPATNIVSLDAFEGTRPALTKTATGESNSPRIVNVLVVGG